jgi:Flp pilus assembly pilin Flp
MQQRLSRLLHDERGNLVEYLIVIGLVALLAIAAFNTFGTSVKTKIEKQATSVNGINDAPTK